jgi:hypothetical protein
MSRPKPKPPTPILPVGQSRKGLRYGYYGYVDHADGASGPSTTAETADHINLLFAMAWGDWTTFEGREALQQTLVHELVEAKALGIHEAILGVDYCVYTRDEAQTTYIARNPSDASSTLASLFEALKAADVLDMVVALYPLDEPNSFTTVEQVTLVNQVCYNVMKVYGMDCPLGVIFAHEPDWEMAAAYRPGLICADEYDRGAGIIDSYPAWQARLAPDQKLFACPGCAPKVGSVDIKPFNIYAQQHLDFWGIIPFDWWSPGGIRDAVGDCRAVGKAIKDA